MKFLDCCIMGPEEFLIEIKLTWISDVYKSQVLMMPKQLIAIMGPFYHHIHYSRSCPEDEPTQFMVE